MNLLIGGLNIAGDISHKICKDGLGVIAPTGLCMLGSKFMGTGSNYGFLQGGTTGIFHKAILIPASHFIKRHQGERANQIHPNAVKMLETTGIVIEIVGAPIVVAYFGKQILNFLATNTPNSAIAGWLTPSPTINYTVWAGVKAAIVPSILQIALDCLFDAQVKRK